MPIARARERLLGRLRNGVHDRATWRLQLSPIKGHFRSITPPMPLPARSRGVGRCRLVRVSLSPTSSLISGIEVARRTYASDAVVPVSSPVMVWWNAGWQGEIRLALGLRYRHAFADHGYASHRPLIRVFVSKRCGFAGLLTHGRDYRADYPPILVAAIDRNAWSRSAKCAESTISRQTANKPYGSRVSAHTVACVIEALCGAACIRRQ